MGHIYVEASTLIGTFGYSVTDHLYLVYKDDSGTELTLRGGPTSQLPPFGAIDIYAGLLSSGPDARPAGDPTVTRGQIELDLGGRSASDVWNIMTQVAGEINGASIQYNPVGNNSNTVVDTILHALHLDITSSGTFPYPTNAGPAQIIGEGQLDFSRSLVGTSANDVIQGWRQDDTLSGGTTGTDILRGDTGDDTYNLQSTAHSVTIDDPDNKVFLLVDGGSPITSMGSVTIGGVATNAYLDIGRTSGVGVQQASGHIEVFNITHNNSTNAYTLGDKIGTIDHAGSLVATTYHPDQALINIEVDYTRSTSYSSSDSVIYGSNAADSITGGSISAAIYAEAGNDTIVGSSANDLIDGGTGNDSMSGGAGNDSYFVDSTSDVVSESSSAGTDTVYASLNYTLGSNVENLTLISAATVGTGNSAANVITGNAMDNTLVGAAGADTIYGGLGIDRVDYSASASAVSVNLGTNSNSGGDAAGDVLYAVEGIVGTAYNDTLVGSSADELFIGGAGSDYIDGGSGLDTLSFETSSTWVSATLGTNSFWNGDASWDNVTNVENLTGSAYTDYLGGSSVANVITGGAGNDSIEGFDGNDTLSGGAGDDLLYGGNGDDKIIGGPGSDYIDGGSGNDTLSFETSANWISGNLGSNSYFNGDASWDNVLANVENLIGSAYGDYLGGSSVANNLDGGAGNDSIEGFDGNDTLVGGAGDDLLYGGNNDDLIIAGPGSDYVDGGAGSDTLSFETSATWVSADLANNSYWNGDAAWDNVTNVENLKGSAYADYLYGNSSANVLTGGDGDDYLEGRGGNDSIYGGNGADALFFGASSGVDTVYGFEGAGATGGDVVRIASSIYSTAAIAVSHVTYGGGEAVLDLGSGNSVHLVGITGLTAGDFTIV